MNPNARDREDARRRSRRICLGVIVVLVVVIIAVVVPVAIILSKRKHQALPASVLLPLYIYPGNNSWDPVFQAAKSYPNVNFTVIVNPDSGPGSLPYPTNDYTSGIQKLNTYSNIKTIGYVKTGFGTRNITSILQDVQTYSGWSKNSSSIAMHGIFFDEVVYDYTADAATYMQTIDEAAKAASGLLSNRVIVHNPGTIPDSRLTNNLTDITVVFEGTYAMYGSRESKLAALPSNRSEYCYMVHSVADSLSSSGLQSYIGQLSQRAEYLFLTDLSDNYYESWGSTWQNFVAAIPT